MARIETWLDCDLKKIIRVHEIKGNVFTQDHLGNLIGVRVYDDGEPVTLAGSVNGYCILADGSTVPVDGDRDTSGNRAWIILPQSAYAVPGTIRITIKLTETDGDDVDHIVTLASLVGTVTRSKTDNMVTPSSQVITDWSQEISAEMQEVSDAAAAAAGNFAAAYSTTKTYSVGEYVTYNGALYRCTTAVTTAGSWSSNSAKFAAVKMGNDVADLKSAFGDVTDELDMTNYLVGMAYSTGKLQSDGTVDSAYTALVTTDFIPVIALRKYIFGRKVSPDGQYAIYACIYDSSKNFITNGYSESAGTTIFSIADGTAYIRISIASTVPAKEPYFKLYQSKIKQLDNMQDELIRKLQKDRFNSLTARSANLFIYKRADKKGYYSNSGNWVSNSGLRGMYIEIQPNTSYTISGDTTWNAVLDGNMKWVASHNEKSSPYTLNSGANGYFLYVSTATANVKKIKVNAGDTAITITDGYEIPIMANKCLQYGDVSPSATDFMQAGSNLINKRLFVDGHYYSYTRGTKTNDAGYSTIRITALENTTYTFTGAVAHITFWTSEMDYISGVLSDSTSSKTFTTPENTKYIILSPSKSQKASARLNIGETDLGQESFRVYIPELIYAGYDYSKYKYPYIRDGKVLCNKGNNNGTAYYAGVDCGTKINIIEAKFIWEAGSTSGVVALISNPNGADKITDITALSVHLTLTATKLKVDILGQRYGAYYYQNLINQTLGTAMALDGETVHDVILNVQPNSEKVYVTLDGTTYEGTFTPDSNIASIGDAIGQYATFEHFTDGDRNNVAMPMFTYFMCRDINNVDRVYDSFDREDGQLMNTPQGLPYHLISTNHNRN